MSAGGIFRPRSPFLYCTTVCTVDLLTEKCFAAARTVAPCAAMYSPSVITRFTIYSHIGYHLPRPTGLKINYVKQSEFMQKILVFVYQNRPRSFKLRGRFIIFYLQAV